METWSLNILPQLIKDDLFLSVCCSTCFSRNEIEGLEMCSTQPQHRHKNSQWIYRRYEVKSGKGFNRNLHISHGHINYWMHLKITILVVATYVSGATSSSDHTNTCPCVSTSSRSGKRGFVIWVVVQLCSICFRPNRSFGGGLKCSIITSSSQECVCTAPLNTGCSRGAGGCGIGDEGERYSGRGGYCWT